MAQPKASIVIEKPFGHDLASARKLNSQINAVFSEDQVFRIDHYLGKETVQNILVFRFANGIFEPIWNRNYIDHVQITVAETLGVEGRGPFYESAGALRDVVQNHMMELLSLVALEPPSSFEAESVRREKLKVWRAIPSIPILDAVRGQYGPGQVDGQHVSGYREEERVSPASGTETYAAVRLDIENWRWAGVPFYLRAGKRLKKRATEISIQFKQPPLLIFDRLAASAACQMIQPNLLTIRIQPDEGIALRFGAKVPTTPEMAVCPVNMDFDYAEAFGKSSANGYERLLLDAMLGDQTLFAHRDGVETTWALYSPIIEAWAAKKPEKFPNYVAGSWGPECSRSSAGAARPRLAQRSGPKSLRNALRDQRQKPPQLLVVLLNAAGENVVVPAMHCQPALRSPPAPPRAARADCSSCATTLPRISEASSALVAVGRVQRLAMVEGRLDMAQPAARLGQVLQAPCDSAQPSARRSRSGRREWRASPSAPRRRIRWSPSRRPHRSPETGTTLPALRVINRSPGPVPQDQIRHHARI